MSNHQQHKETDVTEPIDRDGDYDYWDELRENILESLDAGGDAEDVTKTVRMFLEAGRHA